jgi:hypothetical protein
LKKVTLDLGLLQPKVESKPWSKQMYRTFVAVIGLGILAAAGPAIAAGGGATEAGELEAARLNALAGGPNSGRDAELLDRYGCESGTNSAFCRRLEHRDWHNRHHRYEYDRRHENY